LTPISFNKKLSIKNKLLLVNGKKTESIESSPTPIKVSNNESELYSESISNEISPIAG
jgi:hypothetical protein